MRLSQKLKLMCVLAHPDDESLGTGGTLAKYASEGIETYVVTATRGERGRFGDGTESPGPEAVGKIREAELRAAANELGVREVNFLDYVDKDLDQADPDEAQGRIAAHLRRVKPHVVVTFGPDGAYGHPDHIAISQLTTAAVVRAADPTYSVQGNLPAHCVSKLYYMAWTEDKWTAYQTAFRSLKVKVDGTERQTAPWPDWAITTVIDTSPFWPTVWRAVCCHKTQMAIYKQLEQLSEKHHQFLWGSQDYYRVFSLVNGGRNRETDLFEGLRPEEGDKGER
jgi:LmbE family N-acetylglucosaminyl deacetylase